MERDDALAPDGPVMTVPGQGTGEEGAGPIVAVVEVGGPLKYPKELQGLQAEYGEGGGGAEVEVPGIHVPPIVLRPQKVDGHVRHLGLDDLRVPDPPVVGGADPFREHGHLQAGGRDPVQDPRPGGSHDADVDADATQRLREGAGNIAQAAHLGEGRVLRRDEKDPGPAAVPAHGLTSL